MYLKRIHSVNVGPIENVDILLPFDKGNPKPVVFVGENGTGKSALLSNIVDSFFEMASTAFSDIREKDDLSGGQQYYKAISPQEIHIGQSYMYSYLEYIHEAKTLYSFFKSGELSPKDMKQKESDFPGAVVWNQEINYKATTISDKDANDVFSKEVICYFGPERYEKPNWLGNKYYQLSDYEHLSVKNRWSKQLDKPISVVNANAKTLQWLLDIIVDSRCDIEQRDARLHIVHAEKEEINEILGLGIARKNVERIMSTILGEEIYFGLNYRNSINSRFNIISCSNNKKLIPALDALSTGQSALFNMFSTIIRYAESSGLGNSIALENITGIVVIDEIELHLHTNLQREVLPKLLKLFPKVQFIITSHAPLFLLGMDEEYGKDGYEIYQMPSAIKISSERFSEFQKAYEYFSETEKYHKHIKDIIQNHQGKPLVITEGATDWKHMKAALNYFLSHEEFRERYSALNFEFLEYEPENSKKENCTKLKMGNSNLINMCEQFSRLKQSRKIIFIADADDKDTNKKLSDISKEYKNWGNNVFSFVLPLPTSRQKTPEICIEHYYTDEEIKTAIEINGIARRLYMGNEFSKSGISLDIKCYCCNKKCCGKDKINIIDGDEKARVCGIDDGDGIINLALPKMDFATGILEGKKEFKDIKFDNFHLIFDVIQQIFQEPLV